MRFYVDGKIRNKKRTIDYKYIQNIQSTGAYVVEWDITYISKGEPYPCRMQKFDGHVVTVTYDNNNNNNNIVVVVSHTKTRAKSHTFSFQAY